MSNKISSMMPDLNCPRLEILLEENKDIAELYNSDSDFREVWDDAIKLQDCINSVGVHACIQPFDFIRVLDGFKYIKDIEVGDLVLTHNGRFKKVTNTISTFNDKIYKLKCSKGMEIGITGNHPVRVISRYVKTRYKDESKSKRILEFFFTDPYWKNVEDLDPKKDFIAISNDTSVHSLNFNDSLPFDNPDLWWLLGLFVADGWNEKIERIGKTKNWTDKRCIICCEKKDDEVLEISNKLNSCNFKYRIENSRTCYKFHINERDFFEYCESFGSGAKNKALNSDVLNAPLDFKKAFCEGYLYGDGSESKHDYSCNTSSRKLAIGLIDLFNSVYEKPSTISLIPARENKIEGRRVFQSEQYRIRIPKELSSPNGSSYVTLNGIHYSRIKSITEEYGEFFTYNFSVEDDESYVCNGVVVHNCGTILSDNPIYKDIPLWESKGTVVTQYEANEVESLGYVKLDLLGSSRAPVLVTMR